VVLIFGLTLSSCKKYLDIKNTSTQKLAETADDCQRILDNYNVMNTGYPSDGEASADDYYLNEQGYLNTNLTQEDRNIYIWSTGAIRASAAPQWQNSYTSVFYSNLVLETLKRLQGGNTDVKILRGSALFFRAYAFWQVAQLYAKPYSAGSALQDPGIPLRMTSDIAEKSTRGTVQQTYNQIIQDLQEAVTLLPNTSLLATRPNKAAANAMLARVYLSMEDYTNALNAATAALTINSKLIDYNTLNQSSLTPFEPRFNKEVIFHSIMTGSPMLMPGEENNPIAIIAPELANSYDSNDLRKNIFFKPNMHDVPDPANPGSTIYVPDGTYRFTGNYEPSTNSNFFNGLAVDELFLIRAECYARANKSVEAMKDLNTLLTTRWITGTYVNMTAASADDALTKILTERRKELLMRGIRWTDLRRLNKDARFKKDLNRTIAFSNSSNSTINVTLPANDSRYTLLIPQEVINNSFIAQNTR